MARTNSLCEINDVIECVDIVLVIVGNEIGLRVVVGTARDECDGAESAGTARELEIRIDLTEAKVDISSVRACTDGDKRVEIKVGTIPCKSMDTILSWDERV